MVAAGTSVVQPLEGELTGAPEPEAPMAPRTLSLTYTSDPGIDAQLGYVLAYWSSYNTAQYPVIDGYDCANFASQSLIARGWAMDGGWYLDGSGAMSPSWASSTALRDYLLTRTDRASYLDDGQRSLVKVGDIAQFDWDGSGDRDHTAVVTRVEHTDAGTKVWVGGHTKDADYWDVDTALANGRRLGELLLDPLTAGGRPRRGVAGASRSAKTGSAGFAAECARDAVEPRGCRSSAPPRAGPQPPALPRRPSQTRRARAAGRRRRLGEVETPRCSHQPVAPRSFTAV